MKIQSVLIIFLVIIIILLIIGYFIIGNYFYNIALNPDTPKEFVLGEETKFTDDQKQIDDENNNWLNSMSKETYITSTNNGLLKLHAYEIKNSKETNIWTIVIHGYMCQGKDMVSYAKEFYNRGYNVLVLDLRGHGKSEGEYVGMGWHDRLDVIDWVDYLISKNSECKIILFGVSMGAATVMMTTGETLPTNVKLGIEDCGYTSIWNEFEYKLKELFNLPEFPVLMAVSTVCKFKAGYKIKEGSTIGQLKKSKTPTLFIHGDQDKFVPFDMLDKLYEVANCEKQKLVIEGAGHAKASKVNSELYWNTIDSFIEKYL